MSESTRKIKTTKSDKNEIKTTKQKKVKLNHKLRNRTSKASQFFSVAVGDFSTIVYIQYVNIYTFILFVLATFCAACANNFWIRFRAIGSQCGEICRCCGTKNWIQISRELIIIQE